MSPSHARFPCIPRLLGLASVAILALAACTPQAPAPTVAPPKPAPTTAPAQPAPTTAPAKAEAPTARPAPTTAPAAKPTEKPATKAAEFDEKAVADFYKGKTIRIVVGQGPGGSSDTNTRVLQPVLSRYIPGNPTIVVENRPGGGTMLATNTVSNAEPKDGTVIVNPDSSLVLQQATSAPGVQFDLARFNWLGSTYKTVAACAARTGSGINSVQEIIDGGKELAVASFGKGTISFNPPAAMNAALGTRFKIVTGYESGAAQTLAVRNKEVQGWCTTSESMMAATTRDLLEGANPAARVIVTLAPVAPDAQGASLLKGVPTAESLAKTDEARALLKPVQLPDQMTQPFAMAPDVPKDRVTALRRAFDRAYADPEFATTAREKLQRIPMPSTGEEVTAIVQAVLGAPPATLAKLRQALE